VLIDIWPPTPAIEALYLRHAGAMFDIPCRAGEVGGDDVGGVPVEGDASSVVAHRGSRSAWRRLPGHRALLSLVSSADSV
jgi:hypothetical protein